MTRSKWQEELAKRFSLDEARQRAFVRLLSLLQAQKDRSLTAVTSPGQIVRVHFLDSLWLLGLPEMTAAARAVDVGSGAGFPGMPLAIARPDLHVTMIEANRNKAEFITATTQKLGLENTRILTVRAEEAGRTELRESFDVALARAVGSLPEVLEYTLPLTKVGGSTILQRGARQLGDETAARAAARSLGGELDRIIEAKPYPEAKNLHAWVFNKKEKTPDKYPRRAGMARKRSLA